MTNQKRERPRDLWLILAAVLLAAVMASCGNGANAAQSGSSEMPSNERELGTFDGLSAEIELRVLQDFFDAYVKDKFEGCTLNDIYISNYYGTYNGCVVADIESLFWGAWLIYSHATIADVVFIFPDSSRPVIWKNGLIYWNEGYGKVNLLEAFEANILTYDDLVNIAALYNPPHYQNKE